MPIAGEAARDAAKPKEPSADTVQIIAHASLDPELIVSWASEAGDFNFGVRSTLVSVCEGMQLRDADTEEWTDSISGADRIFCTTDVTFSHAEPLARKFSAIFNLEATLDPAAGCLKFCGVTPDEFGGVDPSEIIQVNPPPQAEVLKQPYVGSIRMLDLVMEKGSASAAQNHFGPEGETRFKGEGSSFSSSSCQRRTFRGLDSGSRDYG